jgi:hypothetical protein
VRRPLSLLLAVTVVLAGCSDDDADAAPAAGTADVVDGAAADPRFCDVYLDYLAESTPENLGAVEEAADDPLVAEYADVIGSDADFDVVLAATLDLDDLARERCQPEWTAGAQGAGETPAAAQAFFDAVVAGDRTGARNVASANAIAVFDPWEPIEPDEQAGTPALADVGGQSFSLVLGPATVAQCEVETGVVVACQRAD